MNLLVFGATGSTGRQLLAQALSQGHRVTAFARDPADLSDVKHPRLRTVRGDVMHPASIAPVMPGHDAVLVALGSRVRGRNTVLSGGTANIIWQMHQANVNRLIVLSSLGAGESRAERSWLFRHLIRPLLLRDLFDDKDKQETHVRQSGLNWTLVRPTSLTDGPATGCFFAGKSLRGQSGLIDSISRADVAAFMLHLLSHDQWTRKAVALTGADRAWEGLTATERPATPQAA